MGGINVDKTISSKQDNPKNKEDLLSRKVYAEDRSIVLRLRKVLGDDTTLKLIKDIFSEFDEEDDNALAENLRTRLTEELKSQFNMNIEDIK